MKQADATILGVTYVIHAYPWPSGKAINDGLLKQQVATAVGALYWNAYTGSDGAGGILLTVMLTADLATIDTVIAGVIAAHDANQLTQDQQDVVQKDVDWANVRTIAQGYITQGNNGLTAIDNDLASMASVVTAINAATTLAQVKTAIGPWLTVQQNTLNRQKLIIQFLLWAISVIRWLVPSQ